MRPIFWLILAGEFPGKFPIHTEMNAAHAVGTVPRLSHFRRQGLARFVKSPERTVHDRLASTTLLSVLASLLHLWGLRFRLTYNRSARLAPFREARSPLEETRELAGLGVRQLLPTFGGRMHCIS